MAGPLPLRSLPTFLIRLEITQGLFDLFGTIFVLVQLHRFLIQFGGERPAGIPQGNSVVLLKHRSGQHRLDFPTERRTGVGLAASLDNLLQAIGIEGPAKIVELSAQTVRLLVNVRQLLA